MKKEKCLNAISCNKCNARKYCEELKEFRQNHEGKIKSIWQKVDK